MPDIPYGNDHDDDGGVIPPPDERPLFPPPTAPLDVARKLYEKHLDQRAQTLVCWRGGWLRWNVTDWSELDVAELRSETYDALGRVAYKHPIREKGFVVDYEISPWSPDKHKVANVIEAMAAIGHLSPTIDPRSWIGPHSAAKTPAAQIISCRNGLLDLSARELAEHTPLLFNVVAAVQRRLGAVRLRPPRVDTGSVAGLPRLGGGPTTPNRLRCYRNTSATCCRDAPICRRCCC